MPKAWVSQRKDTEIDALDSLADTLKDSLWGVAEEKRVRWWENLEKGIKITGTLEFGYDCKMQRYTPTNN